MLLFSVLTLTWQHAYCHFLKYHVLKKDGEEKVLEVISVDDFSRATYTGKIFFSVCTLILDEAGNEVFVSMDQDSFPKTDEARKAMNIFLNSKYCELSSIDTGGVCSVFMFKDPPNTGSKVNVGGKSNSTKKKTPVKKYSTRSQDLAAKTRKKKKALNDFKAADKL